MGSEIISARVGLVNNSSALAKPSERSLPEIYFCKLEGATKSAVEEQRGVPRRSQEGRPVVQDHPHGQRLQVGDEPTLGYEGLEEEAAGQPRQDLGRDSSPQVDAAGRRAEERQ